MAEAIVTTDLDDQLMRRALALAERGRGWTAPNPMVGAVVVRDGQIIAEGFHARYGAGHAEACALQAAGPAAEGATLVVTLEPCSHHGKTPPCVEAVLESGVARVVVGMQDPHPAVNGISLARLRNAGLEVTVGVLEPEARKLNLPFISRHVRGRPWVVAKYAMTLDGRIATASGDSRWVTGEQARKEVHELRARYRAIMVGYHTACHDNPDLTCRLEGIDPPPRQPVRLVLGGRDPLSADLKLASRVGVGPESETETFQLAAWQPEGQTAVPSVQLVADAEGWVEPRAVLDWLHERDLDSLFIEGGGKTLGAFFQAGLVDEVFAFIAPKLLGSDRARSPLAGRAEVAAMSEARPLQQTEISCWGTDVLVHGYLDTSLL